MLLCVLCGSKIRETVFHGKSSGIPGVSLVPGVVCEAANRESLKVYERKAMQTYESLKHTKWDCKNLVVFIPRRWRMGLYQGLRWELGAVFCNLAEQSECKVAEGHLLPDHMHSIELLHDSKVRRVNLYERIHLQFNHAG